MKNKDFILSVLWMTLVLLKYIMPLNHILAERHPIYIYQKHFEWNYFSAAKRGQ